MSDDLQTQELLDAYVRDLQAGRTPDRAALLAQRPELASALDCLDLLERIAPDGVRTDSAATLPLRAIGEGNDRVGKYVIERELGRGGMGVVYLAFDSELNRRVALKMILAGSLASEDYLRRFQGEVRASARLDHDGIVRVYDSGEFNGLPYLAMQYIDGPSLAEMMRRQRPDADAAVRCAIRLARAVEYLHANGIVHRDLKPANILLSAGRESAASGSTSLDAYTPRITDFGLAKLLEEDSHATRTGVVVGTPSYMAPEQARGESREVGPAADVYALGSILYELLAGRPPFAGETSLDTLIQVMGSEPVSPRRFAPSLHPDLEAICLKCLEKAPERRFASAAELADVLERYLKGEDVPAAHPSIRHALERWVRRNPSLAARLIALMICMVLLYAKSALTGRTQYGQMFASVSLGHVTLIFGIWLVLSWFFQRYLRRGRGLQTIPYIWAVSDVAILTVTLLLTDSLVSPIDIGFPIIVTASGLWLRERVVWFTLGVTIAAYAGATGIMWLGGYDEQLHRHGIFIAGLLTAGFLIAHQVRRFNSLSRYYEGK